MVEKVVKDVPLSAGLLVSSSLVAAAVGDYFQNDGKTVLYIVNNDVSPHTVTVKAQKADNQGVLNDIAITVPASGTRIAGPFAPRFYNDGAKKLHLTYDAVTGVSLFPARLP